MAPKVWRKGKTQRRGVWIFDGGLRVRTSWMPAEIYEKMNICDECKREGELDGAYWSMCLYWTGSSLLCKLCRGSYQDG